MSHRASRKYQPKHRAKSRLDKSVGFASVGTLAVMGATLVSALLW